MTDKLLACPNCKSTSFIRRMEEEMIVQVADLGEDGFEDRDTDGNETSREYAYFCYCRDDTLKKLDLEKCLRLPLKGDCEHDMENFACKKCGIGVTE